MDLKRSYKDGDKWKETTSINGDQGMAASNLLHQAYELIRSEKYDD